MGYNLPVGRQRVILPEDNTLSRDDLLEITDKPIVPEQVIARIEWDECGALVTFTGRVRSRSEGKRVLSLEHDATKYGAERILNDIAVEMRKRWNLGQLAFCYRTGPVEPGGITLVIAVAAFHRPEAFAACEYAIDSFKQTVSAEEVLENG
jgi:molybdopterin synthase catalytic subunit